MTGEAYPPEPEVRNLGTVIGSSFASCEACGFRRIGQGRAAWLATRAAARRHVAYSGHAVVVSCANVYTYAPAEPVRRLAHL